MMEALGTMDILGMLAPEDEVIVKVYSTDEDVEMTAVMSVGSVPAKLIACTRFISLSNGVRPVIYLRVTDMDAFILEREELASGTKDGCPNCGTTQNDGPTMDDHGTSGFCVLGLL